MRVYTHMLVQVYLDIGIAPRSFKTASERSLGDRSVIPLDDAAPVGRVVLGKPRPVLMAPSVLSWRGETHLQAGAHPCIRSNMYTLQTRVMRLLCSTDISRLCFRWMCAVQGCTATQRRVPSQTSCGWCGRVRLRTPCSHVYYPESTYRYAQTTDDSSVYLQGWCHRISPA